MFLRFWNIHGACNFIKRRLQHSFFCEYCKIFKNIFIAEYLRSIPLQACKYLLKNNNKNNRLIWEMSSKLKKADLGRSVVFIDNFDEFNVLTHFFN